MRNKLQKLKKSLGSLTARRRALIDTIDALRCEIAFSAVKGAVCDVLSGDLYHRPCHGEYYKVLSLDRCSVDNLRSLYLNLTVVGPWGIPSVYEYGRFVDSLYERLSDGRFRSIVIDGIDNL